MARCGRCGLECTVIERPHLTPPMRRLSDCCSHFILGDFPETKRQRSGR